MRLLRGIAVVLVVLAAQLAVTAGAGAQTGQRTPGPGFDVMPRFGIGYVAHPPEMVAGGAAWALFDILGGLGLYVDAKVNIDSPAGADEFWDGATPATAESFPSQALIYTEESWSSVNAALMRPLSRELMLYAGAGIARRTVYLRYRDQTGEGEVSPIPDPYANRTYWVEDATLEEDRLNLLVGAFFRLSNPISLHFGLETEPQGMTIGVSYSLAFP